MQLLRASSDHSVAAIDYNAINGETAGDVGIPHADVLVEFAEATVLGGDSRLAAAREALTTAMGVEALVDSAGVVGLFNAIDRVADSTGIPIEDDKAEDTAALRSSLGIDDLLSAAE